MDGGYQTSEGKKVDFVEGHDDLEKLMKRSISPEGEIVYYPVLLKESSFEAFAKPQVCDETLKIHYQDGEVEELQAEPFQMYYVEGAENLGKAEAVQSWNDGEIPVFQINSFDEGSIEETLAGAENLKNVPIAILDLRSNPGGSGSMASRWINEYTGNIVPSNKYTQAKFEWPPANRSDKWVSNDNWLIILVGKLTASAAEWFLDYSYNVENVLLVGENTFGAALSSSSEIYLPNSGCQVRLGVKLNTFPDHENYFEELRGFYPDLWVPAGEAEELVIKLVEQLNR